MKRIFIFSLVLACVLSLVACAESDSAAVPAIAPAESSSLSESSSIAPEIFSSEAESSSQPESSSSQETVSSLPTSKSIADEAIPVSKAPSSTAPTSSSSVVPPETAPSGSSTPENGSSVSVIELEDDHDQNKWNVGAGIKINDYYESGSSRDQVLADVQALAEPYGLIVTKSGFIGNGSSDSAGKIRVSGDNNGNWKLYIYAWRSSTSETGFSASMNTTLQVMKYFLGDENGANLWSFWDAIMTGQNPSVSNYDMSDDAGSGSKGNLTFSDGTVVSYDAQPHQLILTLT